MIDPKILDRIVRRGTAEIIVEKEFIRLLNQGRALRLKMGFDPSRPDIHLGHVVGLRKLRQLQELGHQVILIVGDWTAQIGDPSGQSITRPMLTHNEVMTNAESYLIQFFKVVDRDKTQTVLQSEWFDKFTLSDVIDLTSRFTVAQFLDRDDFSKRFKAKRPIAITELLYPLLQAYDSVAVKSDVEFGGTDQKFNLLVGRALQSMMGQRPQQCFLMPILVGTDGTQKMSKSLGNFVAVEDPPDSMYGKIMSLPDNLIVDYFEVLTDVSEEEFMEIRSALDEQSVNPMDLKKHLAFQITGQFHGMNETIKAQDNFRANIQLRGIPEDIPKVGYRFSDSERGHEVIFVVADQVQNQTIPVSSPGQVDTSHLLWVLGLTKSRSEGKRLITQGAVEIDGNKNDTAYSTLKDGSVIKAGRRRFVRLVDLDKPT